jgi:hypothetical protein
MTKSQKRAKAHQERMTAQQQTQQTQQATDGTRSVAVEWRRRAGWDRWAKRGGGGDYDYGMNG